MRLSSPKIWLRTFRQSAVDSSEQQGRIPIKLLMLSSGSYHSTLSIRLRHLARHLAGEFDVTIIARLADEYNDFTPDNSLRLPFARLIQPWQLATRKAPLNLLSYVFSAILAILRCEADMIVIYKPTPITALGLLPKLLGRTQVVLDMDDLGSEVMKREGRSKLICGLVAWSEWLCIRYADAVIVVSTALFRHALRLSPTKPVLILPNGVEAGDYREVASGPTRHAVYYFGAINRLDLIEDLLRAMPEVLREVPDVQLNIIGGGSALDDARCLSSALGVDSAVVFSGWQTNMLAVQDYTQFADIGVCCQPDTPAVRAASNMKVFQYMAMRTVPLVSNVGDLGNYVRGGQAGVVVTAGDVGALARALIELLLDEDRRASLANEALRLAKSEYSWEGHAAAMSAFMTKLIRNDND